jgi:phenylacetate-coenzyme A ligase PaaK-like adenylate-forming protein
MPQSSSSKLERTPLDAWSAAKTAAAPIAEWQLVKLRETVELARNNSPFYSRSLRGIAVDHLSDIRRLPFMDGGDIAREGARLLCVPQREISRVVTLFTSGSTCEPKRVFFTGEDIELTADFFAGGLPTVAQPGKTMLVMLPCRRPDGVGDLICRGLRRAGVKPVPYGLMENLGHAAQTVIEAGAESIVGMPAQLLALTRYARANGMPVKLTSALLSADYIPETVVNELNSVGIETYKHYGMTETGLGCAIDCGAHMGCHIREPDLLLEIVDPQTGTPLSDGEWGEIVFTTLTRKGMPMIRYRTGDISRLLPGICRCGSSLKRLDNVKGRINDGPKDGGGIDKTLAMPDLDEIIFAFPQVMDFKAEVSGGILRIEAAAFAGMEPLEPDSVRSALSRLPALRDNDTRAEIVILPQDEYTPMYKGKRMMNVLGPVRRTAGPSGLRPDI